MNYDAVLFDLDGTLLDTLRDLAESVNAALAEMGYPTHPIEAYRTFVGCGAEMLGQRALPEDARDAATVAGTLARFQAKYRDCWRNHTRLYDGVPEMLDALTARGMKLAVLSNKPHAYTKLCVDEFLSRWPFDLVLGQRDGIPHKPDPTGAIEVAREMSIPAGRFIYLGDSGVDMTTATGAGMFAVGVLWGFREAPELRAHGALALIASPSELLDVLGV